MSFNTNKYTRPVLLKNLKSINVRKYSSFTSFVSALSPRAGAKSAKIASLTKALGVTHKELQSVFTSGNTVTYIKSTLINILK